MLPGTREPVHTRDQRQRLGRSAASRLGMLDRLGLSVGCMRSEDGRDLPVDNEAVAFCRSRVDLGGLERATLR